MIDHGIASPQPTAQSARSRMSRHSIAQEWIDAASSAGLNPHIVQQPLSSEDAGEWHIATRMAEDVLACLSRAAA